MSQSLPADPADRELLRRSTRPGGEAAFRLLYRRHVGPLSRLLTGLLREPALVEDALQETWWVALECQDRFEGRSALRTWLLGIALNVGRALLRQQSRRGETDLELATASYAPQLDLQIDLERALARLEPAHREVFTLHELQGWSHGEIARELACPVGTSRSHLHVARRVMRSYLSSGEA